MRNRFGENVEHIACNHADRALRGGDARGAAVPVRGERCCFKRLHSLRQQRCDHAGQHVSRAGGRESLRSRRVDVDARAVVDEGCLALEQRRDAALAHECA